MSSEELLRKNSMNWRTRIIEINLNVIAETFMITHLMTKVAMRYSKEEVLF